MAARGEVQTNTFFGVIDNPDQTVIQPDFAVAGVKDCCFDLPLFGDISDTDQFKNDRTGFFKAYDPNLISSVDIILQKCVNGTFVDVVAFIDNKYGTFSSLGTFQADGLNYISMYMDWRQVLIDPDTLGLGEGTYRLKTDETNILASVPVQNQFTFRSEVNYNLRKFNTERANNTVRFDTVTNKILGDIEDQKKTVTFPTDWLDGIRLPSRFGNNTSEYEEERVRFNDGFLQFIQDDQMENYVFETDRLPAIIHNHLKTNVFQANTIQVTDYNTNNANKHVLTEVVRTGGYEPVWDKQSKLAKVTVELKSAFDNLRKLNC